MILLNNLYIVNYFCIKMKACNLVSKDFFAFNIPGLHYASKVGPKICTDNKH